MNKKVFHLSILKAIPRIRNIIYISALIKRSIFLILIHFHIRDKLIITLFIIFPPKKRKKKKKIENIYSPFEVKLLVIC